MSQSNPEYEYQGERLNQTQNYIPSKRFGVSEHVMVADGELDSSNAWTNTQSIRRKRPVHTASSKKEGVYVSMLTAGMLVVFLWIAFGVRVLMVLSEQVSISNVMTRTIKSCEQLKKENGELEAQLAAALDEVAILKVATQELNMVAPNRKNAITLTAVDTRPRGEETTAVEVLYSMQGE